MRDIVFFLCANFIALVAILLYIAIRHAGIILIDKFVDWVYERIKEKEMGEYIENQFNNSRRKHIP